jgi:hypothetical protein
MAFANLSIASVLAATKSEFATKTWDWKRWEIAVCGRAKTRTFPVSRAIVSSGSESAIASIRCEVNAETADGEGTSMTCSVLESPPFLSIHARIETELRSCSDCVPIVFPFRSRAVRNGESFATSIAFCGRSLMKIVDGAMI